MTLRTGLVGLAAATAVLVGASAYAASAAVAEPIVSLTTCTDQMLSEGVSGPCVRSLQHSLNALGSDLQEDGIYGPRTRAAVVAFQRGRGLLVDGIAGPQTLSALDRAANSPPPAAPLPPPRWFVSAAKPTGTVVDGGVYACGNLFGTCSFYLSRTQTRALDEALSDWKNGAAVSGAGFRRMQTLQRTGRNGLRARPDRRPGRGAARCSESRRRERLRAVSDTAGPHDPALTRRRERTQLHRLNARPRPPSRGERPNGDLRCAGPRATSRGLWH